MTEYGNIALDYLPEGFSYRLYMADIGPHGHRHYGITVVDPKGAEYAILDSGNRPVCFAGKPDEYYDVREVREKLMRAHLGATVG